MFHFFRAFVAIILFVILVSLLGGCATTDQTFSERYEWSRADTVREIAFQTVNVADGIQTAQIRNRPDLREGSELTAAVLGVKPKPGETALYFASIGVSHFLIAAVLPPKWRKWYQGTTLTYTGATVFRNCEVYDLCL